MRSRLPDLPSVLQVYAVIAVLFSGWTVTAFLWKLSALLLLLNLGELVTVFAYGLAASFIEGLLLLLLLLCASAALPGRFLRDDFAVRGTLLALGLVGALMAFVGSQMLFGIQIGAGLLAAPLAVLFGASVLLQRSRANLHLRRWALNLSDRLIVFLLILVPLYALLGAYVLYRNVT